MPYYIINDEKTDGRYNEIHVTTCSHCPAEKHQVKLGWHSDAVDAKAYAKINGFPDADGCGFCSREAHRG